MKRFIAASALLACALWFCAPSSAAALPALPKSSESFNSGSLHVDVYGAPGKPAMLLIPGLTCGPWEWAGEIAHFSPQYTIYALTLPGFDGQPAIQGPLFDTVSADIWTLMQSRGIQKPVLVGHSLGGTIGILLAEQHPDRLRAVVAVDGMPIFPGMQLMSPAQREAMGQQIAARMTSATTPAAFEAAEKTYVLPYMIRSKDDVDAAAVLAARSDPAAVARWTREDIALDLRAQLPAISVPLLEIVPFDPQLDPAGPARLATPAQKKAYYASLLEGARTATLQTVSPSRHFVMLDQPAALDSAIERFIENPGAHAGS